MTPSEHDRLRAAANTAGRLVGTICNGVRPQMFMTDQDVILLAQLLSHLLAPHPDLGSDFHEGRASMADGAKGAR